MPTSVLVIDDEYGVRTGVRQILEMEGYDVVEAHDGRSALAALDCRPFDVALIDYQLPDLDGMTLLGAIRGREHRIMTCMITAYANIDTAIAATRRGVDFFLPKPFTPEDLLGVVSTLAGHKALHEEAQRLRREHERSLGALATEQSQTRSLVASLRDAVLVVNREGNVALANAAMAEFLGRRAEDLVQVPARELLSVAPFAGIRDLLDPDAPEHAVHEVELGERSYLARATAFLSESSEVLGRILTIADVTALRRMALEKSRFIRTMVHEFRAPLGAIKSLLEVAIDGSLGPDPAAYKPLLERAGARVDGLAELIGELLSLSQIDLEKRKPVPGDGANVGAAVAAAVEVHRARMNQRHIELTVEVDPDLPRAAISEDCLLTVLVNLVGNATKYNRDGGTLSVTGRLAGGFVRIAVHDTGIGIRAANLGRLFEEFYREKRPETREIEGNGLGLSIVKRWVEQAGGLIDVTSTEGQGSTFSVRLPATGRTVPPA